MPGLGDLLDAKLAERGSAQDETPVEWGPLIPANPATLDEALERLPEALLTLVTQRVQEAQRLPDPRPQLLAVRQALVDEFERIPGWPASDEAYVYATDLGQLIGFVDELIGQAESGRTQDDQGAGR